MKKNNNNKEKHEMPLEELNREEGGFKIRLPEMYDKDCDENEKIKQLRWNKGYLVQHLFYETFSEKETILLYNALVNVLGKDNVLLL